MKRNYIAAIILSLVLLLSLPVSAAETPADSGDIVILYTNDIHTYMQNESGLTYSRVAALKDSFDNVMLVDIGDHLQGTAYGAMDKGATIVQLMNEAGYDYSAIGNHEFDYGMDGFLHAMNKADYTYLSCNFLHKENGVDGESVPAPFTIAEIGGKKIAFIGITTPSAMKSSAPAYFQNEKGEYIYNIAGGEDGTVLYGLVQNSIDAAAEAGADYIIALGHLGIEPSAWSSYELIAHTTGLDAFIDGHSHTVMEGEIVADADGNGVLLTQTGYYLQSVGQLTISADGQFSSRLLHADDLAQLTPDAGVKAIEDAWAAEIDRQLGQVIGYSEIVLDNYDADGTRLVRRQETNSGDFAADALYFLFAEMGLDVDVAVTNGGGVRNKALSGELTYLSCREIHPFGNVACLQTVTGQQLLDALEWGVRAAVPDGSGETGAFLQVSGLRFTLDLSVPSTVQQDDKGIWIGGPTGEYRVKNVEILDNTTGEYQPLDPAAQYNLAGYNYILRNLGDGFAMFNGSVNVLDYAAEDYMVLANYIESFPASEATGLPTISAGDGYDDIFGSGRVTVTGTADAEPEPILYTVCPGDSLWKIAKLHLGKGSLWKAIYAANRGSIRDPDLIYAGQTLVIPAA